MPFSLVFIALVAGIPLAAATVYAYARGGPGLRRYVTTRIILTVPMVLVLGSLVFLLMRVIPGDPTDSDLFLQMGAEQREQIREQLGLNDPLVVQYWNFLGDIVTLDFGDSLTGSERPVLDEIGERFPATLEMVIPAALIAVIVGVWTGTIAAQHRRSPTDLGLRFLSVAASALPIFWVGLMLQLIFGVALGWTPVSGRIDSVIGTGLERTTNMLVVDSLIHGDWEAMRSVVRHLVLPVATIAISLSGMYLRLSRINVIDTLQQDYILAARARGVQTRRVVYGYGLKNALIPVITVMGLQIAILLGGAVLTETVFSWPGMGRYLIERIFARDFTAVQGGIVVFAIVVAVASLIVDIVYSLVDPRIRL